MTATFSKHKIMDMINKSARIAKLNPTTGPAMFISLRDVVGLVITERQFGDLVRSHGAQEGPLAGLYRVTLWRITADSYDAWR